MSIETQVDRRCVVVRHCEEDSIIRANFCEVG